MRVPSTITIATLLATILTAGACDGGPGGDPGGGTPAFEADNLALNSTPDRAVEDTTVLIRMNATPLYSGKGRFAFNPVGGELTAYIQAPVRDTIQGSDPPVFVPVEFVANEPEEIAWEVRFKGPVVESGFRWGVEGTVAMDSVRIDGALHDVRSEKAREFAGRWLRATVDGRLLYGDQ